MLIDIAWRKPSVSEAQVGAIAETKQVSGALERAEAKLERRVLNQFLHANGGEQEAVFDKVASGIGIDEICKEIGVSRTLFYRWLKEAPERSVALARARADAADSLVEMAMALPDAADTALDMKRAELKGKTLLWTAGKWNREVYGDSPAVQINISAGEAHLSALRKRATSALDVEPKDTDNL